MLINKEGINKVYLSDINLYDMKMVNNSGINDRITYVTSPLVLRI